MELANGEAVEVAKASFVDFMDISGDAITKVAGIFGSMMAFLFCGSP